MALQVDYTALRTLKTGHTSGTEYDFTVTLKDQKRMSNCAGVRHISVGGLGVTNLHRADVMYLLTTNLISSSTTPDLDDLREFLDSVKAGETFQLDVEGTSEDYVIDDIANPYQEIRHDLDQFRFVFKVRKI